MRERLPTDRSGTTRAFRIPYIDDHGRPQTLRFWVQANVYEDGRLAELFINGDKTGSLLSGVLDTVAILMSMALQHGVPMSDMTAKLRHSRFGPSGVTGDAAFPMCSSMFDLVAAWLDSRFPDGKVAK